MSFQKVQRVRDHCESLVIDAERISAINSPLLITLHHNHPSVWNNRTLHRKQERYSWALSHKRSHTVEVVKEMVQYEIPKKTLPLSPFHLCQPLWWKWVSMFSFHFLTVMFLLTILHSCSSFALRHSLTSPPLSGCIVKRFFFLLIFFNRKHSFKFVQYTNFLRRTCNSMKIILIIIHSNIV